MESKSKNIFFSQRFWVIVCLAAAAALTLVVVIDYQGNQETSVLGRVTTPIRKLSQSSCAAREAKQMVKTIHELFQKGTTEAPHRVRLLHVKEARNLKQGEVGVPPLEQLLDKMTLEEQVGQIIQPENSNARCYEVSDNMVGSVFFGGNDSPGDDDGASWHKRVNKIQHEARKTEPNHVPVFVGVDTIHGMSHMRGATFFPHNIALGCTRNEKLVEEIGRITAEESAAVDVNWGFSPCVALATDIRWGRIYESFGQDPDLVGRLGAAYVRGGNSISKPFVTCGKHFVGDGGARYGTGRIGKPVDRGDWTGSMQELRETHMKPYEYLVKAGVGSIMASYSSINGTLMHGNGDLINGELKGRMGFKGFVSSDYNAINALNGNYHKAVAKAINAGVDQIMLGPAGGSNPYPNQLAKAIKDNVESGAITKERIRDAAQRVLWAKFQSGLMDQQPGVELSHRALEDQLSTIGSREHRRIARQAVQESTVILENKNQVLPLDLNKHSVCLIGNAADNGGKMLGGWTLGWQGEPGTLRTKLTTIWTGLQIHAKMEKATHKIKYAKNHQECSGSDVAIVVIGEDPYAEFMGDRTTMPKLPQTDLVDTIHNDLNIPVILVAISGRPVDVESAVEKAAGFVVSFVPGSEGGFGINDVLFGKVEPKGKLSLDWPKSGHALVRIAEENTLLYKYGDGLTWKVDPKKADEDEISLVKKVKKDSKSVEISLAEVEKEADPFSLAEIAKNIVDEESM